MSNLKNYCRDFFVENFSGDKDFILLSDEISFFIDSGEKEDAFTVFYAFSEIFKLFGSGYDNIKLLLDLLKEYEHLSGQLLQKQRDHYSHSVFVFVLGLAMYQMDGELRHAYNDFYNLTSQDGFKDFVYHWGLTALFHDIGYPFQLTFDQLKEYCVNFFSGKKDIPYVMYGNMSVLTEIPDRLRASAYKVLKKEVVSFDAMFAGWISKRLGYNENQLLDNLQVRIVNPPYSIDHGYFSSLLLANKMMEANDFCFSDATLDVLTAILLHNSLNRYDIQDAKPISLQAHPLAYLLILCDELQSWNRQGFGKGSKLDILPQNIDIEIQGNKYLTTFIFESTFEAVQDSVKMIQDLKETDGKIKFDSEIMGLIQGGATLQSSFVFADKPVKQILMSDSRFFNLLEIAKSIHFSYMKDCTGYTEDYINTEFANLALEFKLANIHQAKSYAKKLSKIGCFYSDESLDYKLVKSFHEIKYFGMDCTEYLARDEHVRWVREHISTGWRYGTSYLKIDDKNMRQKVRDELKEHKDMLPYDALTDEAKQKDLNVVNNMILLLQKNGNIKVYQTTGRQKPLIYFTIDFNADIDDVAYARKSIEGYLNALKTDYDIIIGSSNISKNSLLLAECARSLNIPYEIVLVGMFHAELYDQSLLQLFAAAHFFKTVGNVREAKNYLNAKSDRLIHLSDLIA